MSTAVQMAMDAAAVSTASDGKWSHDIAVIRAAEIAFYREFATTLGVKIVQAQNELAERCPHSTVRHLSIDNDRMIGCCTICDRTVMRGTGQQWRLFSTWA